MERAVCSYAPADTGGIVYDKKKEQKSHCKAENAGQMEELPVRILGETEKQLKNGCKVYII